MSDNNGSQPVAINVWDAQARTIEVLAEEAMEDLTSKNRLRKIAIIALAQLMAMTHAAKAGEETAKKAESSLLLPDKRLII